MFTLFCARLLLNSGSRVSAGASPAVASTSQICYTKIRYFIYSLFDHEMIGFNSCSGKLMVNTTEIVLFIFLKQKNEELVAHKVAIKSNSSATNQDWCMVFHVHDSTVVIGDLHSFTLSLTHSPLMLQTLM